MRLFQGINENLKYTEVPKLIILSPLVTARDCKSFFLDFEPYLLPYILLRNKETLLIKNISQNNLNSRTCDSHQVVAQIKALYERTYITIHITINTVVILMYCSQIN